MLAYDTMFRGTAHVVLGSGLTIAGAMLCLSFTRLPYFQTMGVPCAIGTLVAVLAAHARAAVIKIDSRWSASNQARHPLPRVAPGRRPGGAFARTCARRDAGVALVGLVTLPGYKTNYDARRYVPAELTANVGYAAAERHFQRIADEFELLMVQSDHDLRNSADFLVINKIAEAIVHTQGSRGCRRSRGPTENHQAQQFRSSWACRPSRRR